MHVARNDRRQEVTPLGNPLAVPKRGTRSVRVEASVFDRRLIVALDGELLFEPLDFDEPSPRPPADESPIAELGGALHPGPITPPPPDPQPPRIDPPRGGCARCDLSEGPGAPAALGLGLLLGLLRRRPRRGGAL